MVDALGLKSPIVVGHSMGGMIAAEMAAVARTDVAPRAARARRPVARRHPIPDLFALLPFELPGLLFHDAEAGEKL